MAIDRAYDVKSLGQLLAMNSGLHAIIFALAVIVPGGLVVYFSYQAWRRYRQRKASQGSSLSIIPVNGKAPENSP